MSATKGYYSIIQYCPDASRLEAANIGVLLLCPDIGYVRVRTAKSNDRIRRFFKGEPFDLARVNAAKKAIEHRVTIDRDSFRTPEDLVRFIDTRGNDIILTQPRPMRVLDPERDLAALFRELVGGRARRAAAKPEIPELERIFRRPSVAPRIQFDYSVSLPVIGRALEVPYAFRNGAINLVKPQHFSADENRTISTAMRLAIEGDLLSRHPVENEQHKLILVPTFEQSDSIAGLRPRLDQLFGDYNVRVVHREQLNEFAREVETQAHA